MVKVSHIYLKKSPFCGIPRPYSSADSGVLGPHTHIGGQPAGLKWIDAYKIRLIKSKIQETAAMDPTEAFHIFDDDGSGHMDRMEIVQVDDQQKRERSDKRRISVL